MEATIRRASHAGSWYVAEGGTLSRQLTEWLGKVPEVSPHTKALIGPHAGYSYSGPSAAWAYKYMNPAQIKRIFILGPSHHFYTPKCCLSTLTEFETPIGNLQIDREVVEELYKTGSFEYISKEAEEDEHSLEMHLPYIVKVMEGHPFSIVPIMVGSVSKESEKMYGGLLSKYLEDPDNFFVVSSDFCHWGKRFDYTHYDEKQGEIWKSIEVLDKTGIKAIETGEPTTFVNYLRETKNTICGRHPIAVMMWAVVAYQEKSKGPKLVFRSTHYTQSSKCRAPKDSSVSYAALILTEEDGPLPPPMTPMS
eukprot:TRINITY_DN2736_c0_g1_i1.p1 TRINITY_DN2736_c0_g1~~TRINITY_DN2736_c0_g1_i1.p1  ORF type:complete len:308 (-),score=65.48 TRINITY_DN2736_c0_g1_i1:150-1073(-)